MEMILWTKPAVVMSSGNGITVDAIVGEEQETERFSVTEFPEDVRARLRPGMKFLWYYVEDPDQFPRRFYRIEMR